MASWELKTEAVCLPVSVAEAKANLRIEASNTYEDNFIEDLIRSASYDAENKTGRILVTSTWTWIPDTLSSGVAYTFPVVPVTSLSVYDEDIIVDSPEGSSGESTTQIASESPLSEPPANLVDPSLYKVVLPSLAPQGSPLLGYIEPQDGFPTNVRIELTVGYPIIEEDSIVMPTEPCAIKLSFVKESTGYIEGVSDPVEPINDKIVLVFNRRVQGFIKKENFSVVNLVTTTDPITSEENIEEFALTIQNASIDEENGVVVLEFLPGTLQSGIVLTFDFSEGLIEDIFGNMLDVIENQSLPVVDFNKMPNYPPETPVEKIFISKCPDPIKKWIQVRVSTLYQQRSEIALRAGKSNDAMFPDNFINSLLSPYILRSMY